jgi:hypothetical protein
VLCLRKKCRRADIFDKSFEPRFHETDKKYGFNNWASPFFWLFLGDQGGTTPVMLRLLIFFSQTSKATAFFIFDGVIGK